jgi:hypothetical protein
MALLGGPLYVSDSEVFDMDKKITRRAVLGTAVAALAAGPFVIRALREKKSLPFDERAAENAEFLRHNGFSRARADLFEEWKVVFGKFGDVSSFLATNGNVANDTVKLRLDFLRTRSWNFRHLSTLLVGKVASFSECAAANLASFEVTEGTVATGNGILTVSVETRIMKLAAIDEEASQKDGVKITKSVTDKGDGVKIGTMTTEPSGIAPTFKIVETNLEVGTFALMSKDENGFFRSVDRNGHVISTMEDAIKANYPTYLAETMCPLFIHPYPEDRQLKVGEDIDLSNEKGTLGKLYPATTLMDVKEVNGTRVAVFGTNYGSKEHGGNEIMRSKLIAVCVDLDTGLSVLRREAEEVSGVGIDTTTRLSIFRIS